MDIKQVTEMAIEGRKYLLKYWEDPPENYLDVAQNRREKIRSELTELWEFKNGIS